MSNLIVVGVNHNTAPVEVREKISFSNSLEIQNAFASLKQQQINYGLILSTCNRTELYLEVPCDMDSKQIIAWLEDYHHLKKIDTNYIYIHQNTVAIAHLMQVAVGLDSMILGEAQILGQLKDSYQISHTNRLLNANLEKILQTTFQVAKKIRTQTDIGKNSLSIAQVSVQLAQKYLPKLSQLNALIVGAGQTSKLVFQYLSPQVHNIFVANRTLEKAQAITKNALSLEEIAAILPQVDLIISATSSSTHILNAHLFEKIQKPVLLIDLAVPRDIDLEIADLPGKTLLSVDDLQPILQNNLSLRQKALEQAQIMINQEVQQLSQSLQVTNINETIKKLNLQANAIKQDLLNKNLDPQTLANQLTNKLLHNQIIAIRQLALEKTASELEKLFNLGEIR